LLRYRGSASRIDPPEQSAGKFIAGNAFRMFAHAPVVGAATLRLVFALLTETDVDPNFGELIGYFRMICVIMTTLEVEVESPFGAKVLDSLRDAAPGQPGQIH
jgi:hypothetical protein